MCDIDGCLTPGKGRRPDSSVLAEIQRYNTGSSLSSHIPPLTLCSGRSLAYVKKMVHAIGGTSPAIAENGALFYYPDEDKSRFHPLISSGEHRIRTQMAEAREIVRTEILGSAGAKLERGKTFVISINPPEGLPTGKLALIVRNCLKTRGLSLNITHSASAVDVTPEGIDKFSALQLILQDCRISAADVAGIGDSEGDLPILDNVGFSAAPRNATGKIKRRVDYVSDFEDGRGVIDIIRYCRGLNRR